ncbi:MAG: transposase [Deltaproteobacteria bacterium]|nr:transposase [Deltaproteobacteria bacterium]
MPRQARIDSPGALHHIICRGIEGRNIFRDDADRQNFMDRLGSILRETSTACYAWTLIPNHFHLLLRTGNVAIATVMRRMLTGYAVSFNRRHGRHGHLFQNRYKSILCQEDPYFLELVRYIHLNPLRAGIVTTLGKLDQYPYCGHSVLMGKRGNEWQDIDTVLSYFGRRVSSARKQYRLFVEEGIELGRRPELIGGGLIRTAGGWNALKALLKSGIHLKSDERILGDSDFVQSVLEQEDEQFERRYRLKTQGYDFDRVVERVAEVFEMKRDRILTPGKEPQRVKARSLVCYWAVKELGMAGTAVAQILGMGQSGVSRAVRRGEKLAHDRQWKLFD